MCVPSLDWELPPELEGREDAEVALAQGDEGRQQHHRIRGEVVRLELIEFELGAEEGAHWKADAAQEVRAEDHPLALLRLRRDFLCRREADLHLVRAGQPPRVAEKLDVAPHGRVNLPTHARDGTGPQAGPATTVPRHAGGFAAVVRTVGFPTL